MKPQTFKNKLQQKGFRQNASGLFIRADYPFAYKPIANKVKVYTRGKGFDGSMVMIEAAPHKLESMEAIAATFSNVPSVNTNSRILFDANEIVIADAPFKENPLIKAEDELYNPTASNDIVDKDDTTTGSDSGSGGSSSGGNGGSGSGSGGGSGGSSSPATTATKEKTFLEKYKWFILAGAVILVLIFNEQ